jgi:hypothetical protein
VEWLLRLSVDLVLNPASPYDFAPSNSYVIRILEARLTSKRFFGIAAICFLEEIFIICLLVYLQWGEMDH